MDLSEELIHLIENDDKHLFLKEDLYDAGDIMRCVIAVLIFLDVYEKIRDKLTYDNVDDFMCKVCSVIRPELDISDIGLVIYILKDGGFLFRNLRKKDERRCFYVAY